jgi:hypothetical protein
MRRALLLAVLALLALPGAAQAAYPGENGKIAFSSTRDNNSGYEVYVMDNDGTSQTRLTTTPRDDYDPEWSPDGTKIVFTSRRNGPYDVYIMNPDGSGQTNLTAGLGGDQFDPTWTPDGTKISFTNSLPGGQRQLWTMNPDGTGAAVLTTGTVEAASWSPDGSMIVGHIRVVDRLGGSEPLVAVNSDGTNYHQISCCTGHPWIYKTDAKWTPDGRYILFNVGDESNPCQGLVRARPDGTDLQILSSTCYRIVDPSPDGKLIAASGIYLLDADANNPTLISSGNDYFPSWQPILRGYPRPKGAGTIHAPLVPAYAPCTSPNRVHAAPLSFDSCNPPRLSSTQLTLGTPDANGAAANSNSSLRIGVVPGNPGTPADEAEARLTATITDVRNASDLSDYTGNLDVRIPLQITDRSNTPYPGGPGPGTVVPFTFTYTVPCTATADLNTGSTCNLFTTADTLFPGSVLEGRRAVWETDRIEVRDGSGQPFLRQGVFVP